MLVEEKPKTAEPKKFETFAIGEYEYCILRNKHDLKFLIKKIEQFSGCEDIGETALQSFPMVAYYMFDCPECVEFLYSKDIANMSNLVSAFYKKYRRGLK